MKNFLISLLLLIGFVSNNLNAQSKKKPIPPIKNTTKGSNIKEPTSVYKITELSFFNPSHINLLEKQIDVSLSKKKSRYGQNDNYVGGYYNTITGYSESDFWRFLDNEYRHVGNNWFFVDRYFGKKRLLHKDATEFSASILEDNTTNIALNDSIFILGDGSLFNVFKNEFLSSELTTNKRLKLIDLPEPSVNGLSKGDGIVTNWQRSYVSDLKNYNILSDKIVQEIKSTLPPKLEKIQFDNRFSNYILSGTGSHNPNLINRYNVEDYISLENVYKLQFITGKNLYRDYDTDYIPLVNNDSLFITSIRLDYSKIYLSETDIKKKINFYNLAQFISRKSSDNLSFSLDEFDKFKDANEQNKWNSSDPKVQERIRILTEKELYKNYLKTVYFQNSINNFTEEEIFESKDYDQKVKIADKFIDYIPEIIFVYNFRTNKVQLLKRTGMPFNKLKNFFIDKSNTFLVAQSEDNKFTIFNLLNGKEIITTKGIINHISDENKLMLNFSSSGTELTNYDLLVNKNKINGYSLNLNELLEYNKVYYKDFTESNNIDEFSKEEDFSLKINEIENKNRLAFFSQEKTNNNNNIVYSKPYQPDNKTIQNVIEAQLKQFIDGQGPIPSDINLHLNYVLWDPNTLTLKLNSVIDSGDWKYFKDEPYWKWVHRSDEEAVLLGPYRKFNLLEGRISNNSVDFEISPVDAEYAKKVKNGSIKLVFILRNEGVYIPKYNHIAYNRFFDKFNTDYFSESALERRKKEMDEKYLFKRNSLQFFDLFFMKENEDEIPLKSESVTKIDDGYGYKAY